MAPPTELDQGNLQLVVLFFLKSRISGVIILTADSTKGKKPIFRNLKVPKNDVTISQDWHLIFLNIIFLDCYYFIFLKS